ncbi:XRE family transcriptional regulator [Vibrio parahaemolyticus]|nr:XRE family transcriptional regulator [Vibrio parahaemolyticus]
MKQEAFSDVSSLTYISSLECDLKRPIINKQGEVMEVYPRMLLILVWAGDGQYMSDHLLNRVWEKLDAIFERRTDD